jgi:hypothetical protein
MSDSDVVALCVMLVEEAGDFLRRDAYVIPA